MGDGRDASVKAASRKLREEFDAAFREEIVPGIVHNFANPLNGIMGRSSLIQRRMSDRLKKILAEPETKASPRYHQGMIKDIDILGREAERLSDMLHVVSDKFAALTDVSERAVNLSEFLSLEMLFFEFHLEFKHNVKRTLRLDREIPSVTGVPADFTLFLSAMIRHALRSMEKSGTKELDVETGFENGLVRMQIGYSAAGDPEGQADVSKPDPAPGMKDEGGSETFPWVVLLTKKYRARIRMERENGWVRHLIEIPCRPR